MSYVGWDWARDTHDVTVIDDNGGVLERWAFPHAKAGWLKTAHRLRAHGEPGDLPVIIEKTSGLVVDRLLEPVTRWCPCIPPRSTPRGPAVEPRVRNLTRVTVTSSPTICAPTDTGCGALSKPALRELQALVRLRDDQVRTRTAATNQLTAILDAHWPGARQSFQSLVSQIALAFLTDYPTQTLPHVSVRPARLHSVGGIPTAAEGPPPNY
jgi:hypothetical protein